MKKIPKKYQPEGFEIIYEDQDIIVGNKAAGYLTVAANWNRDHTIHSALNDYIRKGNPRSTKCVFVVHRLDQATSGLLVFAKTPDMQNVLKNRWKENKKIYLAICDGHFANKSGTIKSYLSEDEDYVVHSKAQESAESKLAVTEYEVVAEKPKASLVKINLLTGRKNQIRVHMAELGHPVLGDVKYGKNKIGKSQLMLHSAKLQLLHPYNDKILTFTAVPPVYFQKMMSYDYSSV